MIITMRTKLVRLIPHRHVFPKRFLALLAQERHLCRSDQRVIGFFIFMTFCALPNHNHRVKNGLG